MKEEIVEGRKRLEDELEELSKAGVDGVYNIRKNLW